MEEMEKLLESYRKALIFYATESTYQYDKWGTPIERDSGEIARKVLEVSEDEECGDPYEPTPSSEEEYRNGGGSQRDRAKNEPYHDV